MKTIKQYSHQMSLFYVDNFFVKQKRWFTPLSSTFFLFNPLCVMSILYNNIDPTTKTIKITTTNIYNKGVITMSCCACTVYVYMVYRAQYEWMVFVKYFNEYNGVHCQGLAGDYNFCTKRFVFVGFHNKTHIVQCTNGIIHNTIISHLNFYCSTISTVCVFSFHFVFLNQLWFLFKF